MSRISLQRWRRQEFAGGEVMRDLAEDPRPALRGAADHHRIGAGVPQHERGALRRIDVAVGDHRDRQLRLDRGDGVVFGEAGVLLVAGAPVHGERGDAAVLGDARDRRRIAVLGIPAGADLQRDRHVDRAAPRPRQMRATRSSSRISAEPAQALQTFFAGQPMLMSMICAPWSTLWRAASAMIAGTVPAICTPIGCGLVDMVHAPQRLFGAPEARVAGGHLRHRQSRAQLLAQQPERLVGDARHRGEDHVRDDGVGADAHGGHCSGEAW